MEIGNIPNNEEERIQTLHNYKILDTDFEKQYDEIVNLVSYICETPIAVISLVDTDRQWFKAKVGVEARETNRDIAFCAHAINLTDTLIVNDTLKDKRFYNNPLVTQDPNIRFYAGAQLKTKNGNVLGALCAIDKIPRELNQKQLDALKVLSNQVITMLELRRSNLELEKQAILLNGKNETNKKLFRVISHDLRSPFHSILGLSEILCEDIDELSNIEIKDLAENIKETASDSFELVNNLLNWSLHKSELKEANFQDISLSMLFKKLVSVLVGVTTKKGIRIAINLDENSRITADYNIIYSAFQNIITNAIKFTPKDGTITISCKNLGNKKIVKIEDTGIGLNQQDIDELLSENGKCSTGGTSGEKGTGIGFSIAKDFILLSGGKINITSEKFNGTSVIVSFG